MKLIFEKHKVGRRGFSWGELDVPVAKSLAAKYCRKTDAPLPCLIFPWIQIFIRSVHAR